MENNPRRLRAGLWCGFVLLSLGACANYLAAESSGEILVASDVSGSQSFFDDFFRVYTPRRQCMYNEAPVIWLHLISDLLIALAYYSIPLALAVFVRKREDLAFGWIFWMFAAFILACGTTHFFGVIDLWVPMYKLDGVFRLATAIVSVVTAILLWPLIPRALALPSPALLEKQVRERTAELASTNEALLAEIEARKRAEAGREQLLESERALRADAEHANRSKDDFLATLSHELRTPLNSILGWTQLLQRDSSSPEDLKHGLTVIERNARAQTAMIEDLLDMSRIIAGKMRLDMSPVDLRDVIHQALQAIQPAAAARQIVLKSDSGEDAAVVRGDAHRLQQVFWNLLSNAVKFTPHSGLVQITIGRAEGEIEVAVRDNGAGIDSKLAPHLFERFRQADSSTTRRFGGLGLGLAIVRHIVELHGGTVEAHSDGIGKGTMFVVRLPAHVEPAAGSAAEPDRAGSIRREPLKACRLLLIEDEPDSRMVLQRILQPTGAEIHETGSVREALQVLRRKPVDLVLCDIGLPDEDGYAFMRALKQLPAERGGRAPVIAVTAFARPEDREQALRAGFQRYVTKPFDAAELISVIREVIQSRGDGKE